MVFICPNAECGRKFQEEGPYIEHVRRRHPEEMNKLDNILSKTIMFNDRKKEQQISKLPRLKLRPSQSKEKPKESAAKPMLMKKPMKPSEIISHSRMEVQAHELESLVEAKSKTIFNRQEGKIQTRPSLKQQRAVPELIGPSAITPKQQFKRNHLRRPSSKQKPGSEGKATEAERTQTAATINDYSSAKGEKSIGQSTPLSSKLLTPMSSQKVFDKNEQPILRISKSKEKLKSTAPAHMYIKRPSVKEIRTISESIVIDTPKPKSAEKQEAEPFDLTQLEETKILIIKNHLKSFSAPFTMIEYLSLNNVGLKQVNLTGLEQLQQFSATHNKLTDMSFLIYDGNQQLVKIHLDNNFIKNVILPSSAVTLTMAFNKVQDLNETCQEISRCATIEQIDLAFNPIKKLFNYKFQLLLKGKALKKVDGMKITKIDIDMALEYKSMAKKQPQVQKGTTRYYDRFHKKFEEDYSLAIAEKITQEQYNKMKSEHDEYVSKTKDIEQHLDIIETENAIFQQQLDAIQIDENQDESLETQYRLLQAEMNNLEMMNLLRFADEEQLKQLICTAMGKK